MHPIHTATDALGKKPPLRKGQGATASTEELFPFSTRAFGLVEVVLALGIVSFCLIAILGLFSVGLKQNRESQDKIQAANLASLILSLRRSMPTNTLTIALPVLNQGTNYGKIKVGTDGTTTAPVMNMIYSISTNNLAQPKLAQVYLLFWWPLNAPNAPTNNPGSYYEVVTQVALP
jgi:type II secretory pathway pseudopilin PulG